LRKELKRQIKEDELVSGFERVALWLQTNQQAALKVGLAILVVVAGAWGYATWQQRRTTQAEAAFADALMIFDAPLRSELPPQAQLPLGQPVFESAGEKYKQAAAAFDGVERQYGGHPVALRARYFGALARAEAGETAQAQKLLEEIAGKSGPGLEPALAKLALAEQLRKAGQPGKAAEAFAKLVDDPKWPLPKDHALMELAQAQEEMKKTSEARATYKRIADEFPASVYAAEARRRAENLGSAS
jgi:hypothetical protein